jgi:hypothetical protein
LHASIRAELANAFASALGERRLLFLTDSLGRDLIILLACLLLPRLASPLPNFGNTSQAGMYGNPITLVLQGSSATVTYKWTPDPLVPVAKRV